MLIAAVADLHGYLPDTPECDVLVIAGDICPVSGHGTERQRMWLLGEFWSWLDAQPAERKIGIGGNHDFIFQNEPAFGHTLPWTYLDNERVNIHDVLFWGSPLSGWFGNWAFMRHENELADVWDTIPAGTDVLVTHGPAWGACDLSSYGDRHTGSQSLREAIVRLRPALHITGHIHEAYGTTAVGRTIVGNASCVNARYELVNDPLLFRLNNGVAQQIV